MTDEGNTGINGYKDGFGDAFKAISWIKGILCTGLGCGVGLITDHLMQP